MEKGEKIENTTKSKETAGAKEVKKSQKKPESKSESTIKKTTPATSSPSA